MYNIFICDDNKEIADSIKSKVLNSMSNNIKHITMFNSAFELRSELKSRKRPIDIVIMDIDLGDANGIDLSGEILELYPCAQIIFVSGYDKYYTKVYNVEHIYFIKKPVNTGELKAALVKAEKKLLESKREVFYIKTKKGYTCICLNTIYYFEKDRRKIVAVTSNGRYSFFGKFDEIMDKLNNKFIRCHNSYVINLNAVETMALKHFEMSNGVNIPISKTYKNEVQESFMDFIEDIV